MAESITREQIYGRRVWALLHTTAAYYPRQPSHEDQEHAKNFVEGLVQDVLEYPGWADSV